MSKSEKDIPRVPQISKSSRRMFQYLNEESSKLNHDYIGTEHFLMALTREADKMKDKLIKSPFAMVLDEHRVTLDKVRFAVETIIGKADQAPQERKFTSRALKVVENAATIARDNQARRINPIHYLMAIIQEEDESALIFGLDKSKLQELEAKSKERDPFEDSESI